jgi:hypothetical protein
MSTTFETRQIVLHDFPAQLAQNKVDNDEE